MKEKTKKMLIRIMALILALITILSVGLSVFFSQPESHTHTDDIPVQTQQHEYVY